MIRWYKARMGSPPSGAMRVEDQVHAVVFGGNQMRAFLGTLKTLVDQNYPGGAGLMSGAVFGRAAGASAASHAR